MTEFRKISEQSDMNDGHVNPEIVIDIEELKADSKDSEWQTFLQAGVERRQQLRAEGRIIDGFKGFFARLGESQVRNPFGRL